MAVTRQHTFTGDSSVNSHRRMAARSFNLSCEDVNKHELKLMKNVVDTDEIDKHECDHRRCNSTFELGSDVQLFMLSNCLSMVSQRSTWFVSRFLHLVSLFLRSMCDALRHSRSRQLLVSIQFRPLTCHSFPGVSRRFCSLSHDVYQSGRSRKIALFTIRSFSRVRFL